MKTFLGALGALILLAGLWHTATLRAENRALRDQVAAYESRAAAAGAGTVPRPGLAVPGAGPDARILSPEGREALRASLTLAAGHKAWFVTQANDREAELFQQEIEATFLESGWEIASSTEASYRLREGVRMFIADPELSNHVSAALTGLRAAGLDVFAGRDYRSFFEKQREKNPSFSGVPLAPDQDFVIVVGPKPSAAPGAPQADGE